MFRTSMKKIAQIWFGVKTKEQALFLKRRLSIVYAILGWNAFGIGFYLLMKESLPTDATERRKTYKNITGSPGNIKVYQVTGMTITREFELLKQAKEVEDTEKENNC